jgi:hypothetical protein
MASVKTLGVRAKKVLLTFLSGAWGVFGAWGLVLFLAGEEFGTLDKLVLLAWVGHMGSLLIGWRRRAPQQQSHAAPAGESRRVSPASAFRLILGAGFALVLLSCVLMALGTLV